MNTHINSTKSVESVEDLTLIEDPSKIKGMKEILANADDALKQYLNSLPEKERNDYFSAEGKIGARRGNGPLLNHALNKIVKDYERAIIRKATILLACKNNMKKVPTDVEWKSYNVDHLNLTTSEGVHLKNCLSEVIKAQAILVEKMDKDIVWAKREHIKLRTDSAEITQLRSSLNLDAKTLSESDINSLNLENFSIDDLAKLLDRVDGEIDKNPETTGKLIPLLVRINVKIATAPGVRWLIDKWDTFPASIQFSLSATPIVLPLIRTGILELKSDSDKDGNFNAELMSKRTEFVFKTLTYFSALGGPALIGLAYAASKLDKKLDKSVYIHVRDATVKKVREFKRSKKN